MVYAWFLALATIPCAYLPQLIKLCRRRSHVGVSFSNLCCITFANWMLVMGFFTATYEQTFDCCSAAQTTVHCLGALGPLAQAIMNELGAWLLVIVYAMNFDRAGLARLKRKVDWEVRRERCQFGLLVGAITVELVILIGLALAHGGFASHSVKVYGTVINIILCVFVASHWSLQVYETWLLRGLGSLSQIAVGFAIVGACATGMMFWLGGAFWTGLSQFVCAALCTVVLSVGTCCRRRLKPEEADPQASLAKSTGASLLL